jgi:hypothetical protein
MELLSFRSKRDCIKKASPGSNQERLIEDIIKIKGIGNRIDLHVKCNFKTDLGSLSIFQGGF